MDGMRGDAGARTLTEILFQPQCWANSLKRLESAVTVGEIGKQLAQAGYGSLLSAVEHSLRYFMPDAIVLAGN